MKEVRKSLGLLAIIAAVLSGSLGCGNGSSGGTGGTGGGGGGSGGAGGGVDNGGDPDLIGTWTGAEVGAGSIVWTFVIEGDTVAVTTSGVEAYAGPYTADPTSDPKRFTAQITSCPYTPYIGKTTNGIYEIEGTTLTFAGNEPGNPAVPTSFVPTGATRVYVLTKQ